MSWPATPSDGQQVTISGILYQYDSTPGVWNRVGSGASSVAVDSFTTSNLTVTNHAYLGAVENITISGGGNGYSLTTDGSGNLNWTPIGGAMVPGGANTQIQFNNQNAFSGSPNLTFDVSSSTLTARNIAGNGSGLTSLTGSAVTGTVANAAYSLSAGSANTANTANTSNNSNLANIANRAGTVTGASQPNITSVGILSNLVVSGNISASNVNATTYGAHQGPVGTITPNSGAFTSVSASGNLTVTGNISAGNINAGNLLVSNYVSGTLTTGSQPNITELGTLNGLSVTGEITGHLIPSADQVFDIGSPNARWRTLYIAANTIDIGGATISATPGGGITTSGGFEGTNVEIIGQFITSLATGTPPLVVSSNTMVANLNANLLNGFSATSANVANTIVSRDGNRSFVANIITARLWGLANNAQTITFNAQPNITSVGTLSNLIVSGNISSGNANLGNAVSANFFVGNGSLLTGVAANRLLGELSPEVRSNTTFFVGTTGVTLSRASELQNLTGVNIDGNAGYATTAGTVTTAAQPNITSVGSLTGLVINGNLTVTGSTQYANVSTLNIKDPIIEMGGNPDGTPLSGDDGKDRGTLLHYFDDEPVDAFMGWNSGNGEFRFGKNVSVTSDVVTFLEYGNVRANNFIGNIQGNAGFANTAGTVTTNAQPNITSVGTLLDLDIVTPSLNNNNPIGIVQSWNNASVVFTGIRENIIDLASSSESKLLDLQVGNVSKFAVDKAGNVVASYFIGDGSQLTSIDATNIIGSLPNATHASFSNIANTVAIADQPNITGLGTLNRLQINSGELVSSIPVRVSQTWNNADVLFTTLRANITDTASAPDSMLIDLNVSGNSVFVVEKNGNVTANSFTGNLFGNFTGNISAPGANRQILFNDNGALGGNADLSFNKLTGVLTTRLANINTGVITGTAPVNFTQTWSNAEVTFTGIRQNITDNFSSANSLLLDLQISGNSRFRVDKTGNVFANRFIGSGIGLTALQAANLVGSVPNADFATSAETANSAVIAGTVTSAAQPNITSFGTLVNLRANTGFIESNAPYTFIQRWNNVDELFTVARFNAIDTASSVDSLLLDLQLDGNSQFTVEKDGTVTANGNVYATSFTGDGGNLANINASNIVGTVSNADFASNTVFADLAEVANTAATVTTNAQPNITSIGTLEKLNIQTATLSENTPFSIVQTWQNGQTRFSGFTQNITDTASQDNSTLMRMTVNSFDKFVVTKAGNVTANMFIGDGGLLSNIPTGEFANFANFAGNITVAAQANITSLGNLTGLIVTGNTTLGNSVTANFFVGNLFGTANTAESANTANRATIANTANTANTVTASAQPNITSTGTLTSVVTSGDLMMQQALLTNSNKVAFSSASVNLGAPTITLGSPGALTLSQYTLASRMKVGDQLSISGAIGDATSLNRIYTITAISLNPSTSVNLTVTPDVATRAGASANVSSINVQGLRNTIDITASTIHGFFDNLTVSGTFVANTVRDNAQPNITSVGTLSNLTSEGTINFTNASNVSLGSVGNVKILGGSSNNILVTDGSGTLTWRAPAPGGGLAISYDNFVGDGTTSSYTLGVTPISKEYVSINLDGIIQQQSIFTLADNIVTFASAPEVNEKIQIQTLRPTAGTTGGAGVAGSNTQIQYNNQGDLGSSSDLTFNSSTRTLGAHNVSVGDALTISNVNKLRIPGGLVNSVLRTDGAGNLSWASAGGTPGAVGQNTQVQFNDTGLLAASENFTFNNITNTLRATIFEGSGASLTNIPASNIVGAVESSNSSNVALNVVSASQPNITSVGTLSNLSVVGTITSGNANLGVNVRATTFIGNLDGTANRANAATSANTANTVTVAAQPNITSLGTLVSANISGLVNITGTGGLAVSGATSTTDVNGVTIGTAGNNPIVRMTVLDATPNNRTWTTFVDGIGILRYQTVDAIGATRDWMRVTRTGLVPNVISLLTTTTVTGTINATLFSGDGGSLSNITANNIRIVSSTSDSLHYLFTGNVVDGSPQNVKFNSNYYINPGNGLVNLGGNLNVTGNITSVSATRVGYSAATLNLGVATFSLLNGGAFEVQLTQNSTAAFTNVAASDGYSTTVTVFNRGSTFVINAATINGTSTTVRWLGGVVPAATLTGIDRYTFTITRISGVYTIYGERVNFG